jgi:hypothetical protein
MRFLTEKIRTYFLELGAQLNHETQVQLEARSENKATTPLNKISQEYVKNLIRLQERSNRFVCQ